MRWLERHSWWGLLAIAVVFLLSGSSPGARA